MSKPFNPTNYTNFSDLNDIAEHRCIAVVVCCSICAVLSLPALYAYWFHPQCRLQLRCHFNNLMIGAIALQLLQALQRVVVASSLLALIMTEVGCRVASVVESVLETSSIMLLLGFYYSLLSLRVNPFRTCLLYCINPASFTLVRRYVWFVVALATGALAGSFAAVGSEYTYVEGWCTLDSKDFVFFTSAFPMLLVVLVSIVTMLALRCCVSRSGNSAGISQSLTWERHWTIYVRFFTVAIFIFISFVFITITALALNSSDRDSLRDLSPALLTCLWPGMLSFTFLLTEGLLHHWCASLRLRCALWCSCSDSRNSGSNFRGSRSVQSLRSLRPVAGASSADVRASGQHDQVAFFDDESVVIDDPTRASSASATALLPAHVQHVAALNGFTVAIQSLLVMEVQGVHFAPSHPASLADEYLEVADGDGDRALRNSVGLAAGGYGTPSFNANYYSNFGAANSPARSQSLSAMRGSPNAIAVAHQSGAYRHPISQLSDVPEVA